MKILITGSTGVLGRRLVEQLVARGHSVVGVVRSLAGEQLVASLGGLPRRADLFNTNSLVHAAGPADVVIHAATAIPAKARTTVDDWHANDRIRREGTQALADCAQRIGAHTLLYQSVVWVAKPKDGSPFDENSPPDPGLLVRSALAGEHIVQEAAVRHGYRGCVLRCAWFYSADSGHTRAMARGLARRRMPIIAPGNAIWSCLHVDDAAAAFVTAAEGDKSGLWHVTDNEPVTASDFLNAFAQRVGAPPPRKLPAWLVKLLAGKAAVDFLAGSVRTLNDRFRRDFDWSPRYPSYREGLDQVVRAWQGSVPR